MGIGGSAYNDQGKGGGSAYSDRRGGGGGEVVRIVIGWGGR